MKSSFLIFLLIAVVFKSGAQQLSGIVKSEEKTGAVVLAGATVVVLGTTNGTSTGTDGSFELTVASLPVTLVASFVGYGSDTVVVKTNVPINIILKSTAELKQANVIEKSDALAISTINPRNIETITTNELKKAACCNLSESFETNPTVTVNYADAVTGAKEVQMLGLSGIYTQMLAENIPTMRGLGQAFGLNYIPGPFMESIQINKGVGSVVNGFESLTGSINVEFKKPEETPKAHLNLYASSTGNVEFNGIYNTKVNEKWKTMFMLHGDRMQNKIDHNGDGFLAMPLVKQINAMNLWRYHSGKNMEAQLGVKVLAEDRIGGQTNFNIETDKGTTNAYGVQIINKRLEVYTKTGFIHPKKDLTSLGWQNDFVAHNFNSFFGLKNYNGKQLSYYSNLIYQSYINTNEHQYKIGASFMLDSYDEKYTEPTTQYTRNVVFIVPGVFAEYTYNLHDKLAVVAGLRADYNNKFGFFATPRLNAKYNFTENLILRIAAGNSFRTANIITDNIGFMVSSKVLVVKEDLLPERGWNEGINLTWKTKIFNRNASVATDFYRTDFTNQIIVDPFSDPNYLQFYNLDGKSYAQSFQATFNYELLQQLSIRFAYKMDNVKTTYYREGLIQKPLVSKNKGLINLSYETLNKIWRANITMQFDGKKEIVAAHNHDSETFQGPNYSPNYMQLFAQVTKVFRRFEVYLGGENLTNFTQHNPIVSPENPFSPAFDATDVWGPVMGIRVYAGFRMDIN